EARPLDFRRQLLLVELLSCSFGLRAPVQTPVRFGALERVGSSFSFAILVEIDDVTHCVREEAYLEEGSCLDRLDQPRCSIGQEGAVLPPVEASYATEARRARQRSAGAGQLAPARPSRRARSWKMRKSWTTPRSAPESSVTSSSTVFREGQPGSRFRRSVRVGRGRHCKRPRLTTADQHTTT